MAFFLVLGITLLGVLQPVYVEKKEGSETGIEIINPQSFPIVGGEWTVHFETVGTADLVITAINDTTFGDISPNDLKFLAINDGTQILTPVISGNTITYPNYSSTGQGFVTSQVLTSGAHHLMFEFGNDVGYANNDASDPWCNVSAAECNSDWKNRFAIVINDPVAGDGAGDLSNFPIMVKISGTDFTNNIDSGSDTTEEDIRFFNDAVTPAALDYEIEKFDQTDNELIAWVEIPTLDDDGETTIYMYFDNPNSVSTTAVAADVWDSNFKAVWHLDHTSGTALDSTSNNNDGTEIISPDSNMDTTGVADGADDLDGSDDWIDIGDSTSMDGATTATFEAWINVDAWGGDAILRKWYSGGQSFIFGLRGSDELQLTVRDGSGGQLNTETTNANLSTDTWYHVVGVWGGGNTRSIIIDGTTKPTLNDITSGNPSSIANTAEHLGIGARYNGGGVDNFFDGTIDEVRMSDVARSDGWIETTYNNINDPSTFYSLTVEGIPPTLDSAATVTTTRIDVTFSEDLDATTVAAGDFTVASNTVSAASEDSGVVTLTLGTAIGTGDTPLVTLVGSVSDVDGNPQTSGSATPSDGIAPTFTADFTSLTTIVLTFSENVDTTTTDGSGFAVTSPSGTVTANTDPAGSSTSMTLTVSGITDTGATPTVTYTQAAGTTVDTAANEVANNESAVATDSVAPTFTADRTGDNTIVLTFSENVDTTTTDGSGYAVTGGSVTANTDPAGSSATMTLTTSGITATDATPTVTYTQAAGTTVDTAANEVTDGANSVATDSVAPIFASADVSVANRIDVTFSESMADPGATPGDFVVAGTLANARTVTSITVSGNDLQLGLSGDLSDSDSPTIAFTNSGTRPTDTATSPNNLADFTAQSVTVNIDTTSPTFTADRTATNTIVVTFSETVDADAADETSAWTVSGGTVTAVTDPASSTSLTITYTGDTATDSTPTVTYVAANGTVVDADANEVTDGANSVATDSVAPIFASADVSVANRIDVTFSESMADPGATPGDFVVAGTLANARTVTSITVSGNDLQLGLSGDLSDSDSPTIAFTNSGTRPTDTATSPNNLGDFGPFSFTIDLTTVPTSPQNLYATVVNYEKISISWDAPLDNGGDSISGYKIERESPIGGGWSVLVADTGNTDTDYTDSGLAENTEYNYRVSAINSKGASTPSDSAFAKTLQISRGHWDDKSFPPEFLGIGFYKFTLTSDKKIESAQYENPTESFADYFPYSKYSDVLDKKKYENIGNYEKNGQYFLVDNYLKDIATFSADVDQPVQIQIRLLQERQTLEIHHLAIYLDTEGDSGKDALTYIIVDKDKPVKIVDPEGFFDDIALNTSLEGTDFYYILDLTFKKPMNETDLFVEVWNENRDVSYLQMYDAFEIIDPSLVEEKIEELPTIVQVKLTHDASSPVCKSTNSCYTPKVANILEGGFVIWENQDSFLHTVTSGIPKTGADGKFNEIITPGNSFRYQFDTKGIYNYYCVIHPWATGMVKVYDNDGDLGTSPNTVEELSIKSQRHGSSVIIENQDVLIAERVLKFDVSGNLKDDLGRNPVSIEVTDPNGEKIIIRGATNNDGYFTVPIIIYDWKPGSYSVSVNSKDTQIGSISFFAIQRYDY